MSENPFPQENDEVAPMRFLVTITATGEVRDAEGNLISSTPVEAELELTADQVRELTGEDPNG